MTTVTPERVTELARKHYATCDDPLWLSDLGNMLKDPANDDEPSFGEHGTLSGVIRAAGEGNLQLVRHEKIKARIAVTVPEKRSIVERQVNFLETPQSELSYIEQLPRAMLVAFCHRSADEMYLRVSPPFRYHKGQLSDTEDKDRFIRVDPEFRRPGLDIDQMSDSDKIALRKNIEAWAATHNLPLSMFIGEHNAFNATSNALERFIAAQDQSLVNRILIPADIARILSQHR